jgi:TonB-linked SusC/RagA family outer membrane protein
MYLCLMTVANAQVIIKGKVTDSKDGQPLSGVSVKLTSKAGGTSTANDGTYSIELTKKEGKLEFSYNGYASQTVRLASAGASVDVKLVLETKAMTEVVVTALGIKREKKALGYGVSTVSKKDLELRPEGDIARVLSGKAAGVTITNSSGLSGSGTNITVRAISTITGSSTPLFVVDGVPFNGETNSNSSFVYGNQTSSRFLDLDPNNIESVSILKGLSATTLYGENGRNGVILITTKNGGGVKPAQKTEITVSQSYFANNVANLPEYNTKYGGGFDLSNGVTFYSNWGGAFSNPPVQVRHPYDRPSLNVAFPQYVGALYDYKQYNSVSNFFRKGSVSNTSVNVGGSNGTTSFSANFSYLNDVGFTIGNEMRKSTFGAGGTTKLSNKFTLSGTFNYVMTGVKAPPTSTSFGSGSTQTSVFGDVLYTPTSVDLMGLPYENPLDHSQVYYRTANDIQNPRWTLYNSFTEDNVNRSFGNLQLKYDVMKGLNLGYRVGFDNYTESQLYAQNKGGDINPDGIMRTSTGINTIFDQNFYGAYNKDLNDKWKLNLDGGLNIRNDIYKQDGITSTQQLVYGLLTHTNFVNHLATSEGGSALGYKQETQTVGLYLQSGFSYSDYLYFTVGGRQGWTSTLEKDNRGIFYPSVSASFIPTSVVNALKDNKYINYLKLRAGYATSAEFPGPYNTRPTLDINTKVFVNGGNTSINTNAISNTLPNPNLKPSLIKEFEFGLEGKVLNNRGNFDLSVYNRQANDQLLNRDLDPSTGFTSQRINAGNVTNKGIELSIGYTVVKNKNWKWQLDGLYSRNRSKVSDIPEDLKEIRTSGFTNLGTFAINGQPLGVIKGTAYVRDAKGNRIVGSDGNYILANEVSVLGDPNADYRMTGISTLSYKQFSFRVQADFTHGGDMYSATSSVMVGRGVTRDTEFDRALGYILPGVREDGTPNNIQISATQAYFDNSVAGSAADEPGIFDATCVRIREASLSYSMPQEALKKLPFGSVSFTISGTNLWYYAPNFPKYVHFDPETSGLGVSNGRGLEFITGPSSRRIGASIRVTF